MTKGRLILLWFLAFWVVCAFLLSTIEPYLPAWHAKSWELDWYTWILLTIPALVLAIPLWLTLGPKKPRSS